MVVSEANAAVGFVSWTSVAVPRYLCRMTLVSRLKTWLGDSGVTFFSKVKKEHGSLNAVWMEGRIPHPVHLREGMTVRNWLRDQPECKDWDAMRLDDEWEQLVLKAIEE